jgi:hypothetical protein
LYLFLEYLADELAEGLNDVVAGLGRDSEGGNEAVLLSEFIEEGLSHLLFKFVFFDILNQVELVHNQDHRYGFPIFQGDVGVYLLFPADGGLD